MRIFSAFAQSGRTRPERLRWAAVLVAAVAFLVTLVGCGGQTSAPSAGTVKRLILLTNTDDPYWDACNAGLVAGARQAGLETRNLRMVMEKNDGTTQGQIERLRQFGSQSDIAGVAVSVIQGENLALAEEMRNLAAKGVPVITIDGDVDRERFRDARSYYIGSDNAVAGRLLGQATRGPRGPWREAGGLRAVRRLHGQRQRPQPHGRIP